MRPLLHRVPRPAFALLVHGLAVSTGLLLLFAATFEIAGLLPAALVSSGATALSLAHAIGRPARVVRTLGLTGLLTAATTATVFLLPPWQVPGVAFALIGFGLALTAAWGPGAGGVGFGPLLGLVFVLAFPRGQLPDVQAWSLCLLGIVLYIGWAACSSAAWQALCRSSDDTGQSPVADFPWSALRAHLTWQSPVLRHAVRCGLALGCADLLAHALQLGPHGYWLPLTVAVVLRGTRDETLARHNARLTGTVAGCLATALLGSAPPLWLIGALYFACIALATWYFLSHYWVTAGCTTVLSALQIALLGAGPFPIAERLTDTVIGATLALLFCQVLAGPARHGRDTGVRRYHPAPSESP